MNKNKKVRKRILLFTSGLLIIPILYLSIEMFVYSPTFIYRYIFWNVAEIDDYLKFDSVMINNSTDKKIFPKKLNEKFIESFFEFRYAELNVKTFDEYIKKTQTTALIFLQNDTIFYEKYFNGYNRDSYFPAFGIANVLVSISYGIALDEGIIKDINEPITKYLPELLDYDDRFRYISIKDLLLMRSGIEKNVSFYPGTNLELPSSINTLLYYYDDIVNLILEKSTIDNIENRKVEYNDLNTSILALILTRVTQRSISKFVEEKIWKKIGAEYNAKWTLDRKNGFERTTVGFVGRAIDYAKLGNLLVNKGKSNNKQIVSESWINESVTPHDNYIVENIDFECEQNYYVVEG